MPQPGETNLLIHEPSPYLQQHAHNPVNWYPWGETAFDKAKKENKPILLSIGYAACHWCHVMAHESFEDESTAKIMNELFVNIKVDKEERPDLDKIYQTAHYLLTQQSGGWPLTIFLTPERVPFFSGTYFPKEEHPQLPAFKRVLKLIADFYHNQPEKIQSQSKQIKEILGQQAHKEAEYELNESPLQNGLKRLEQHYDSENGGFGQAPKFPQASRLDFLLHNNSSLAFETLMHIGNGGIYDQLAGGFYRYSVDERWNIPHFEKMLYDNGQLLSLYAQAAKHYSEPFFQDIARQTADWVLSELQAPEGGFYSSYDADSEGEEGKFYCWKPEEVRSLLSKDEYNLIRLHFGLDGPPNFEGYWHFYIAKSLDEVAKSLKISLDNARQLLSSAREKLLTARSKRIKPFRDEKILTSWNSLMVKGLLLAGENLKDQRYITAAQKTLDFIQQKLWQKGALLASYKDGKAYLAAYLDDYAYLIDALLASVQVSWNTDHLLFAVKLADEVLNSFADEKGGFFFTAENHEQLLYRPKSMMDEAIPSGNGVLLQNFLVLGHLLGEQPYLQAAAKILQEAWPMLLQYPSEHCSLLTGLKGYLKPPQMIVIRGDQEEINDWKEEVQSLNNYTFAIASNAPNLPKALALKKAQGPACAYLCRGFNCEAIITSKTELKAKLSN